MINYEFPPVGGGGGNVTRYISKNLAQGGHDVRVITSQFRDLPKYEKLDGFEVHRVPVLRKSADGLRLIGVDIRAIHGSNDAGVFNKFLHILFSFSDVNKVPRDRRGGGHLR